LRYAVLWELVLDQKNEAGRMLFTLWIFFLLRLFRSADLEVIADRAANVFFSLFPAIPFGLTSPVDLACFAAIHFGIGHNLYLLLNLKIHYIDAIVNKIVV
jgi:hypothetical protein